MDQELSARDQAIAKMVKDFAAANPATNKVAPDIIQAEQTRDFDEMHITALGMWRRHKVQTKANVDERTSTIAANHCRTDIEILFLDLGLPASLAMQLTAEITQERVPEPVS